MNDDFTLGAKVIGHAMQALALGASIAIAWSCSSLLMGIVLGITLWIVLSLLAVLATLAALYYTPEASIEGLGRTVGSAAARITSLFNRKVVSA